MKLLRWVVVAVMLLLVILCATGVAPNVLAYTVIPALAALTIIAGSWMERRRRF
jgi:branched-subunit amino acid transport protein AzlD